MEAAGLVLSAAQTLFAALQCSELKELFSMFGYKSELENLESTVKTIKSVLLDADAKEVLSHQEQDLLEKLRYAVYDADDLLDEFATVAALEKQRLMEKGGGFSKKVHLLFSRFVKLGVARKMSKEVKKIRKNLDAIASDASKFSFKVDNKPIRRRREETCSYVYQQDIIGREDDTRRVVDMLLDPNVEKNVSFLAIVGIGGLGKTALAQLVYNDERVKNEFPLRLWACVADQDQRYLDVPAILAKILESATRQKYDSPRIELVQSQLRELLQGRKYLLVLDDIWTEDRNDWLRLGNYLMTGGNGSRVLVTTRSKQTAQVVGSDTPYELQGLTEENSWVLFTRMAYEEPEKLTEGHELVEIGKEILERCANVPLAIRVVGSLLYGQGKKKWLSLQQSGLAKILQGGNPITWALELSYHHLHPALKSCFSYCALYPKDFVIEKEKLISLWMAQGYVEPLDGGQSIEDAADEYFLILLRRCFFQDAQKDEYGEIVSCKIHDLMHDIAQEVAGEEIFVANFPTGSLPKKARHLYDALDDCITSVVNKTKIRTYVHKLSLLKFSFPVGAVASNWTCLRAVDLSSLYMDSLPDSIGNLLHLRYLDLSYNMGLEMLPETITQLHNLQTLKLVWCDGLKQLPKDISKLVQLRFLDLNECRSLAYMPSGMSKLTHLSRLTRFVVTGRKIKQCAAGIESLEPMRNLKGHLTICIREVYTYVKDKGRKGGYLSDKKHLTEIVIMWEDTENNDVKNERRVDHDEALLEDLQPHCNLRVLKMMGYVGAKIPSWAFEDKLQIYLPNLVNLCFSRCYKLQELPWLGELHCLKILTLEHLYNLNYMEDRSCCGYGATGADNAGLSSFFPSLEELDLTALPKLKGWWSGSSTRMGNDGLKVSGMLLFPRLSKLTIQQCHNLTTIPPCPRLETLSVWGEIERLEVPGMYSSASSSVSSLSGKYHLRKSR